MKIDIHNISKFVLKDKIYLSNNVLRFKLDLNELFYHHKLNFSNKYKNDDGYKSKIDTYFNSLEAINNINPERLFDKAFEHIYNSDYYYTNGQNIISLNKNKSWEIVSYGTVFDYSVYLSIYYPFNYNPLGKTLNTEYQIFEQAEQKIFEKLNTVQTINLPLSETTSEANIQEVYPENYILTLPNNSKKFLTHKDEFDPSVTEKIFDSIKPNVIETCINCQHFQFSGMSHDMSGGTSGYCFLIRNQLLEKSVKESITNIWSKCNKFTRKEKADNTV